MAKGRLERSNDRFIAGVCAGLAEWLGWDTTAVRLAWLMLTLLTAFSGIPIYIVLWIIMPSR